MALVAGATACASLPDTSGYTAATIQLKSSAAAAGTLLEGELKQADERLRARDPNDTRLSDVATRFNTAWETTNQSLDGLVSYANSIELITLAGNSGRENAQGVAQSVERLAGAVGFVPGAALAPLITRTVGDIYAAIGNARGARSLKRSLAATDPIIQDIAVQIAWQVENAQTTFADSIELQRDILDSQFNPAIERDQRLRAMEEEIARRLADLAQAGAGGDRERAAADEELQRVRAGRTALAPQIAEHQAAAEEIGRRERAGLAIFVATRDAVANWRSAHQNMVTAIRERRPVSFQSLQAAAAEIREVIEQWRSL